jgi:ureidoglycolate hydrolase
MKPINTLSREAFTKYGTIIEFTTAMSDGWEILITEKEAGWRVALLEFSRKKSRILENHPASKETFEPVRGTTLLIVAESATPDNFEIFLLDKPVCVEKGIWHQVLSLSDSAMVKITENLEVSCEYHTLQADLEPCVSG